MILEIYGRSIVSSLDRFIEDSLNKVNGVNKPFKTIQTSDDFKQFSDRFEDAIRKQAGWAADNIGKLLTAAGTPDNLSPLTAEQQATLKDTTSRDFPSMTEYITEDELFVGLKQFFEWSVIQQYKRWGIIAKADKVNFTLKNEQYIQQLKDRATYLLNQSSIDSTTLDEIVNIIIDNRLAGMTNSELAIVLRDTFDEISQSRADMIARTEAANAMGQANLATAKTNGAQTHYWVAAGGATDELCVGNVDDGEIPIDQPFSSGDLCEPAHPNCECYTEAGEIDLDSIDLWEGN